MISVPSFYKPIPKELIVLKCRIIELDSEILRLFE